MDAGQRGDGGGQTTKAELKRLDVIIAAGNEPVMEPHDLRRIVRRHSSGDTLPVSFLRGGKQRKVTVVL
ncbi:MAG: PDZ domain-containing protein [Chloroflexota bacterium]|nr:PDZ domain-containing protein [Chloroflexota bacterium]